MANAMSSLADNSHALVRVHTLGRFAVEVDGQPLRFETRGQRKPLELLKVL